MYLYTYMCKKWICIHPVIYVHVCIFSTYVCKYVWVLETRICCTYIWFFMNANLTIFFPTFSWHAAPFDIIPFLNCAHTVTVWRALFTAQLTSCVPNIFAASVKTCKKSSYVYVKQKIHIYTCIRIHNALWAKLGWYPSKNQFTKIHFIFFKCKCVKVEK